jgi:hypothetical protein
MLINGLFALLLEMDTIMDRSQWMHGNPYEHKNNRIVATFGQWYLYPTINLHPPPFHVFFNSCTQFFHFHLAFGFSTCYLTYASCCREMGVLTKMVKHRLLWRIVWLLRHLMGLKRKKLRNYEKLKDLSTTYNT